MVLFKASIKTHGLASADGLWSAQLILQIETTKCSQSFGIYSNLMRNSITTANIKPFASLTACTNKGQKKEEAAQERHQVLQNQTSTKSFWYFLQQENLSIA